MNKMVKAEREAIIVEALETNTITIDVGGPRFLMNKLSDKKITEIKGPNTPRIATPKRKPQTIAEIIEEKTHRLPDGTVCYPTSAFKRGMEDAAIEMVGTAKRQVDRAVRFVTDYVPIRFKEQVIYERWGVINRSTPIWICRPEFRDWSCTLLIRYDASVITSQAIVALVNRAGFYSGIGDWRPGKGGDVFGMYRVIENGKE